MEPRIFVSSTFYDLRYARESLGRFIESFGFKPVMFEHGDVGYKPGEPLDLSCYAEMQACDMAILIVGSRYGSPASDEKNIATDGKDDFAEYTSVTCKEFKSAIQKNIPVYVFIDSSVNEQYQIYKLNRQGIEDGTAHIRFPNIQNLNVFRFVHSIRKLQTMPIETFSSINEIESYLRKQWASLLQKYLFDRRNASLLKEVQAPIQEVYSKLEQMNVMLDTLATKVIGSDAPELKSAKTEQQIEETAERIASSFEFLMINPSREKAKEYLTFFLGKLVEAYDDGILEYPFSDNVNDLERFYSKFEYQDVQITDVKSHFAYEDTTIKSIQNNTGAIILKLLEPRHLSQMKLL